MERKSIFRRRWIPTFHSHVRHRACSLSHIESLVATRKGQRAAILFRCTGYPLQLVRGWHFRWRWFLRTDQQSTKGGRRNLRSRPISSWQMGCFQRPTVGDTNPDISFCDDNVVSVLGLSWDPLQDVLSLKVSTFNNNKASTKRSIVSSVAKLLDPLGWVSPVIILPKILIQDLWIAGVSWDEPTTANVSPAGLSFATPCVT